MNVEAFLLWLREQIDRLASFKNPVIYGTLPNPGWNDKDELLVAFKPPPEIARQLSRFSAMLAAILPGSMAFAESVIHSTIAVIRIPDELRDVITMQELSELACGAVTTATNRWLETHPDALMTRYTALIGDQKAIMAWPETTGLLFDLRTAILEELKFSIWGNPGLDRIEIRGSWAEHITLVRFVRTWTTVFYRVNHDLREAMEAWEPTELFPMAAVELSFVSSDSGTIRLDPVVTLGLPTDQPTRA